jgi:hypothetical protein
MDRRADMSMVMIVLIMISEIENGEGGVIIVLSLTILGVGWGPDGPAVISTSCCSFNAEE